MIPISPTLIGIAGAGILIVGLAGTTHYYKNDRDTIQAQFDGYKATVKAQGEKAQAEAKLTEIQNANRIKDAVADRDATNKQLQLALAQARSRPRAMPNNPTAPAGSKVVCHGSEAYNAAFQQFGTSLDRFIQDATGFAYEGDSAALDAKTLIQSWPTTPNSK